MTWFIMDDIRTPFDVSSSGDGIERSTPGGRSKANPVLFRLYATNGAQSGGAGGRKQEHSGSFAVYLAKLKTPIPSQ